MQPPLSCHCFLHKLFIYYRHSTRNPSNDQWCCSIASSQHLKISHLFTSSAKPGGGGTSTLPPPARGSLSLYSGPPPLLVVASTGGELVVLEAPEASHAVHSDEAAIPTGSLTRGFMRAQHAVTALTATEVAAVAAGRRPSSSGGPEAPSEDGLFWVFAACADKSVRRYRMLTDVQRAAAVKGAQAAPRKSALASAQDYQVRRVNQKESSCEIYWHGEHGEKGTGY